MKKLSLLAVFFLLMVFGKTVEANDLCGRFDNQSYSRGFDIVGYAPQGVSGFLANPGTERKLERRGVWFPKNTHFIVFPMVRIGSRIMVMSDTGVFAAIRPNALICLRGDQTELEEILEAAQPIYVGRRSRLHSVHKVNCNEKQEQAREVGTSWEFSPKNIGSIGGSHKFSYKVSFDGEYQKLFFFFKNPVEDETLKITETQSCVDGVSANDPKWQFDFGSSGSFSITQKMLKAQGISSFDDVTGRPVISCFDELNALQGFLQKTPISEAFIPHVSAILGLWDQFLDFDTCVGTGTDLAALILD